MALSFCSSFSLLVWGNAQTGIVLHLFGFLDVWSLYVAEDKVEWAFLVCDSSVLCNPLDSKGGISTYNK